MKEAIYSQNQALHLRHIQAYLAVVKLSHRTATLP